MTKRALIIVADGSEEMEAVITIDVLRRAEIEVTVAGLKGAGAVKCSRGVNIVPDEPLDSVKSRIYDLPPSIPFFDLIVLPGGMPGAKSIAESEVVKDILSKVESVQSVTVAAICAAPIALAANGFRKGVKLTSHPSVKDTLIAAGYEYSEERVVVGDRLVTSRGPGTAFEFALALVELIAGVNIREQIVPIMLLK